MITSDDRQIGMLPEGNWVGRTTRGTLHLVAASRPIYRGSPMTTLGGYPFTVAACSNADFELPLVPGLERPQPVVLPGNFLGPDPSCEAEIARKWWKTYDWLMSQYKKTRVCKRCTELTHGQDLNALPYATYTPEGV